MAYNKVSVVAAFLFLAVAIASRLAEAQSPMFPKMDTKCATMMHDLRQKCFVTASVIPTEDCCNDLKSETKTQVPCLCDNNYIPNPTIANVTGLYSAVITTKCGVLDKLACDATSEARPRKIPTREEFKQLIAALQSGSTSWNYFPRRRILTSGHRMFNQHLLEDYPPLTDQMTSYKSYRA